MDRIDSRDGLADSPGSGPVASATRADDERYAHLFRLGQSISGFDPVGENSASLLADSNGTIDAIVLDIERAQHHVHLLIYIWLININGCKMAEAIERAAARGGLPIGNPLLRPPVGKIDLRNHRKILVVDDRIIYCGNQICADPEFRVNAKYAPWVDAVARFEGRVFQRAVQVMGSLY